MNWNKIKQGRRFLKDYDRDEIDFDKTDQSLGVAMPPIQKSHRDEEQRIDLPDPHAIYSEERSFLKIIKKRRSHRMFKDEAISLDALSFLLMCTAGVRKLNPLRTYRYVPSAGNRHPFETYLIVLNVTDLKQGIYRYLPIEHQLVFVKSVAQLAESSFTAARNQKFAKTCAVNFIWTCLPYRTEWRYDYSAHKVIAIDAGHICQNLYLACEAIGLGTCAIAAYDQDYSDCLLGVDGEDEFTIYMSPVGSL